MQAGESGISTKGSAAAFTLIEMSIVLTVIGLVVGGVLVGYDLILAGYVRAQISQIEKFNTAVNTFYGKYQALPGDMNYTTRATFGFNTTLNGPSTAAGGCGQGASAPAAAGQGDGDGILESGPDAGLYQYEGGGETACYWVDLSSQVAGNLIEGGFATATEAGEDSPAFTAFPQYWPAAKLGRGNYIYAYSWNGSNYFGMSDIVLVFNGSIFTLATMSPIQAYNIDKKIDDGFPNTGNVFAWFVQPAIDPSIVASAHASPGVAGDCFDSTGVTTATNEPEVAGVGFYLTGINQGQGTGCGLSFKMQ